MNNMIGLAIYSVCLLLFSSLLALSLHKFEKTRQSVMFALMCVCFMCWLITDMLTLMVGNETANIYIWCIKLMFVGFAPPLKFLTVYMFYHPDFKPSPRVYALLLTIPTVNGVMAVTSPFHSLLRIVESVEVFPARTVVSGFGPWYWVHFAYCYFLILATIWIIIKGHIRTPKFYRLSSGYMAAAIGIVFINHILISVGVINLNIDMTVIISSIAVIFIRLAVSTDDETIFSRYARGQVFSRLEEFVLIISRSGNITDHNKSAGKWFSEMGIKLRSRTLNDVVSALKEKGAGLSESFDEQSGGDIYFYNGETPVVLNLRAYDMKDKKGHVQGSVATLTDVTQNRTLLERLEKKAGIDYLTGLANRTAYEGAKNRLDAEEHLPLSVIWCDVNGLKEVNDTLGHKYGDILLQSIAEVLEQVTPKAYFVARVGGDEFIFLLPNSDSETAFNFMREVRDAETSRGTLPFILSIAMGAATKYGVEEDLDDIIALADRLMYEDKKRIKSETPCFIL